ncbi:B9 domain-containing protein 1-like isoform X3 [Dermacentor albipictus]|uniref:B9 domain-containing protein 1-like isoform X3 n=1 Tax=Dermacentor albipictus TaxID=60249 RepID=UPI0038FD30C0
MHSASHSPGPERVPQSTAVGLGWLQGSPKPVNGVEEGISQVARKSRDARRHFVWNFPIEITYRSSNVSGWPQLSLAVYGLDAFANDVVRGYGAVHVPPISGTHRKSVALFVPDSSSTMHKLTSWLTGRRPEFVDPKVVARGEGREDAEIRHDYRLLGDKAEALTPI